MFNFFNNQKNYKNEKMKKYRQIANQIIALDEKMSQLKEEAFVEKTNLWKQELQNQKITIDQILIEAFALAREATFRITKKKIFYVQILGALAIHEKNIAEMKTGEGKTLVAILPAFLHALTGNGVHIVTVNEYLVQREALGEVGKVFNFLGLTVGMNIENMTKEQKKQAYLSDVLYSTNDQLAFDYLKDNLVYHQDDLMNQRKYYFAILDEIDSILIDASRTPLIISGDKKNNPQNYFAIDKFTRTLQLDDFILDVKNKTIELNDSGVIKTEKYFELENLYVSKNMSLLKSIKQSLYAHYLIQKNKEYIVRNKKIILIDQFTGRLLPNINYSNGLHQALEAKEKISISKETETKASITYQNFFRLYKNLSGMTGTALTEEEEFKTFYDLDVIEIPTNKPLIRKDDEDLFFFNKKDKFTFMLEEIIKINKIGQPILIGTISLEDSEQISSLLKQKYINHEILNAKNHFREAEIIAKAGQKKSITIATNMAGRGTDIKLGQGVKELGGLVVLGSEKHESRRIDNQLRGRAGRQGDPGYSRFFISAEDDLIVSFLGERFQFFLNRFANNSQNKFIKSKAISFFITNTQKIAETNHYDMRKNLLKFDDIINLQRQKIYENRKEVLLLNNKNKYNQYIEKFLLNYLNHKMTKLLKKRISFENLIAENNAFFKQTILTLQDFSKQSRKYLFKNMFLFLKNILLTKIKNFNNKEEDNSVHKLKFFLLTNIDHFWYQHMNNMDILKQNVHFQNYAKNNIFLLYRQKGAEKYLNMLNDIQQQTLKMMTFPTINENI